MPFARSRIKALRATGLAYASQKFDMGDATVRVRIEPGHEYIEIEGGGIELFSGVADLLGIGELDPNTPLPAEIHATDYVDARNEKPFIGEGKLRDRYFGSAQEDSAKLKRLHNYDTKIVPIKVPASMFSGKTRLYVQSLYGSTYKNLTLKKTAEFRPALAINTPEREAPDPPLPPTIFGTESGVYLHKETGWHYLITPAEDYVAITPMIPSAAGAALRRWIRRGDDDVPYNKGLETEDEMERVEAYILSTCFPHPDNTVKFPIMTTPMSGMGYSWHFNYDGTACDIVEMRDIYLTGVIPTVPVTDVIANISTHFRLAFKCNNRGVSEESGEDDSKIPDFEITRSVIDGPSTWAVDKVGSVVAWPGWAYGALYKLGQRPNANYGTGGPVYAYYKKNILQVVRATVYPTTDITFHSECDPYYYGGVTETDGPFYLTSGEDGYSDKFTRTSYPSATFSCSGITIGERTKKDTGRTISETYTGVAYPFGPGAPMGGGDSVTIRTGVTYSGVYPSLTPISSTASMGGVGVLAGACRHQWAYRVEEYNRQRFVATLVIIPFDDCEAVYMREFPTFLNTGTIINAVSFYSARFVGSTVDVLGGGTRSYGVADPVIVVNELQDLTLNPKDVSGVLLAARREIGDITFSTFSLNQFFDGDFDSVGAFYTTLSSFNGAVVAKDSLVYSQTNYYPYYMAFVGWA